MAAYKKKEQQPIILTKEQQQDQLNALIQTYLDNLANMRKFEMLELEVKFGTRGIKPINRIDYDNVVQKLLSYGFTLKEENHFLRIQCEYMDPKSGYTTMSNVRTEIAGLHAVRNYCKTNILVTGDHSGTNFVQKQNFMKKSDAAGPGAAGPGAAGTGAPAKGAVSYPVSFDDFNFRVSLSTEHSWYSSTPLVQGLLDKWADNKKTFRYMHRYTFVHSDWPFLFDLSIVKESKRNGKFFVPEYTIQDSGVFSAPERYEIEIECDNKRIEKAKTPFQSPGVLGETLKKQITLILGALQETNFPIAYTEQKAVLQDYMRLLWGAQHKLGAWIKPKNFLGPASYTLQVNNVAPVNSEALIPNIRHAYTVTDKADGDRKLLFIAPHSGKIYLINTNMQVQYTGSLTKNKDFYNSLLDGEHILRDKHGKFLNLYTAFDLYYVAGQDIRTKGFSPVLPADDPAQFRLPLLMDLIKKLHAQGLGGGAAAAAPPLLITNKAFYSANANQTIFQGCSQILQKVQDGLFEYATDGLIFTPTSMGVGMDRIGGEAPKPLKTTWDYSFKWKPAEFNTVDFLLTFKKNAAGQDYIGCLFESGLDLRATDQIPQYKTAILRVGFDESKHGYINPGQDIIEDKLPEVKEVDADETYVPMQFYPTNPADATAGLTNLLLQESGANAEKVLFSLAGEVIEDNMIVEFRYDLDKEAGWRWVPLKVRYDKTSEYRAGQKNYGNAYHVANSNWHAIHNPLTEAMITTGGGIPDELADDDIYYNRKGSGSGQNTQALRDFHNLFVKKLLITKVAQAGDTLIDLAVGKGGDFPKWIKAKLKFVFGIDIARDNIQNRLDGACARYLNYRKKFKEMPAVLFVNGNSSVNLRNADACPAVKDKQIIKAVFGVGPKDLKELGKGVYKQYSVGVDGFDICSIQFAIHYMFESPVTLHNFLRNVCESTKVGGYFIGTSYDGNQIFKMLRNKAVDESAVIFENGQKIWEVTKKYDQETFPDESSCLGYAIEVFQESINKSFREYLVNYTYLTRLLENYGFTLLPKDESLRLLHLPHSSGLFNELFNQMQQEIKRTPSIVEEYGLAPQMTAGERTISFLNRYFVYKKIYQVDAKTIAYGDTPSTPTHGDTPSTPSAPATAPAHGDTQRGHPVSPDLVGPAHGDTPTALVSAPAPGPAHGDTPSTPSAPGPAPGPAPAPAPKAAKKKTTLKKLPKLKLKIIE